MEHSSDGLRKAAPNWSLHGDQQLLQLLQNVHQKIIEKCQSTNKMMEDMVSALDSASIHLQNVNNKFTALSNSQFIESRVHEDDLSDCRPPEKPKEQLQPISPRPLDIEDFREGLSVLERMHETVAIVCDSDSDTASDDDDDGTRLVVKPKDQYASRPLPYIIGSMQWRKKWHAGLIPEDSDTESSGSVDDSKPAELYSDSDSERRERPPPRSPTISSSTIESRNPSVEFRSQSVDVAPSQSDIAAELARRLGAPPPQAPQTEPENLDPEPVVRKVYRPHQPAPGTIFPDEPPPIDDAQSEESDHDIFAEIYKTSSYAQSEKDQISVADDLFGKPIFNEQKSTATKPVGAKSIFGSNANSESIGAAILKRKSRHSSTSGDESDQEQTPVAISIEKNVKHNHNISVKTNEKQDFKNNDNVSVKSSNESQNKKERDIFDELFAKSERVNKVLDKNQYKETVKEESKTPAKNMKKVDLFSDNLFDDIDDIFTKSVKEKPVKEKMPTKSIFDDEDDDLFSDLAYNNKNKSNVVNKGSSNLKDSKNLDNANEELKGDLTKENNEMRPENKNISTLIKEPKGLFDDSDDDIFPDFKKPKTTPITSKTETQTRDLFSDVDDNYLFSSKTESKTKITPKLNANEKDSSNTKKFVKSPDLFGDDDISETMSPKNDVKEDVTTTDLPKNLTVNITNQESINIHKDKVKVSTQDDSEINESAKTKTPSYEPVKTKNKPEEFDDDFADDLFGKPVKSTTSESNRPNNETLQESHLTKGKSNDMMTEKENITDNANTAIISNLDTKITVAKDVLKDSESEKVLETTVVKTKVISENNSEETVTPTPDISIKPKVDVINVNTEATQIQPEDNSDILKVNKNNVQKHLSPDDFLGEIDTPLPNTAKSLPESKPVVQSDIFDDLFNDHPPAFEKPKEPKKSKNVNALFDDDSDDESLFLKKNDVVTDERPEGFTAVDDRLFGLFRDEPPAIDVDFVQKPNKKDNTERSPATTQAKRPNILKNIDFDDVDDDIFAVKSNFTTPNPQTIKERDVKEIFNTSNDFDKSDTSQPIHENTNTSNMKNSLKDGAKNEILDTTDSPQVEPKKIGKLKSMNFNIDVNTLLPGASPKKAIKKEVKDNTVDKQTLEKSEDFSDDVDIPEATETKMVKSVSFEGDPDSTVLDNKLSKERAKIKVKRRPSTRRARKEAARKSGIDFGEDVPDNYTSTDDLQPQDNVENIIETKTSANAETFSFENKIETNDHENTVETAEVKTNVLPTTIVSTCEEKDIEAPDKDDKLDEKSVKGVTDFGDPKNIDTSNVKIQSTAKKDLKSKVVYVLNDDDIFNTNADSQKEVKTSIFDDFGDDDDIFNTIPVAKDTGKNSKQANSDNFAISDEPGNNKTVFANDSLRERDDFREKVSKPVGHIEDSIKTVEVDKNIAAPGTKHIPHENIIKTKTVETDSDEELFKKVSKPVTKTPQPDRDIGVIKSDIFDGDDGFVKNLPTSVSNITKMESAERNLAENVSNPIKEQKVKDLINTSDDDDDSLFKNTKSVLKNEDSEKNIKNELLLVDSDEELFKSNNKNTNKLKSDLQRQPKEIDSHETENNAKNKPELVDSDEDLFKNNTKSDLRGQQKETENNAKKKSALVDSDDDLFKTNNNKKVEKVTKSALFDSDSDEGLFGGKQKTKKHQKHQRDDKEVVLTKKVEAKRINKKTSLFGDESDDDDLFGATKRVTESKTLPAPSREPPKESSLVKTKAVLEDPLSMFGDDD